MGFNPSLMAALLVASSALGEELSIPPVYRMTYTDFSQTAAGFHLRALASPDPDLYGEGCVRNISETEAQLFEQALKIGAASQDETISIAVAGVMTVSDDQGRFAGPLSIYNAIDFDGNIYETSLAQYRDIYLIGLRILLANGCEDARFRLEIMPY